MPYPKDFVFALLDIVKYLYEKGHTDNVMHYAKKKKHWHIVEWLESCIIKN